MWGHFDPLRSEILESENGYRKITLSSQYIRGSHVSHWSDTADQESSILKRPGLLTTSHIYPNMNTWQEFLTMRCFLEFFYTYKLYVKNLKI
jgi:hypothetical protein